MPPPFALPHLNIHKARIFLCQHALEHVLQAGHSLLSGDVKVCHGILRLKRQGGKKGLHPNETNERSGGEGFSSTRRYAVFGPGVFSSPSERKELQNVRPLHSQAWQLLSFASRVHCCSRPVRPLSMESARSGESAG